ncbi:Negative regulator of mitotic exit [Didymella glomerata]|uniref:Negative regulator of mitotic exit n=1 Tax=Didymella glomerata TaxID=749621 RepID=A0A9W8X3J1_9PLEO|nr:Negative regulator of mitotic exit [Didymella glomerata]
MSFLFGKKSKQQGNALPPASRGLTSSDGREPPQPASLNGPLGGKDGGRPGPQPQTASSTPSGSVNNSLSSLQGRDGQAIVPEPKALRERAGSNEQNARPQGGPPQESPYPWSSRRLNFTAGNPFPRYGAAINSVASKDGIVYIMGGLVGGATVKGDLWLTEMGNGSLSCYPISTTGDGPGPRVGHASLLVGNAFIVFGGDTKLADNDDLDDTLYLLNTSTKHWSRALPQGPRPTGRYGHTLNILGSKIYIFGGQVEGFFFNDLVAFDLNSLQSSASRWEVLLPNTKDQVAPNPQSRAPPPRTNHSIVTWQDRLYLFGGTDGVTWFNDVWTYEPRSNAWTELDCIGYIPVAREGHSAALVNDTMYVFGGRTQEGVDLGDLAAFRISSRRWYMFQNMGHSPSARSGHSMTAFGKHIVTLAGEPSSSVSDKNELSMAYILDTSKIRYPPNESAAPQQAINAPRKMSGGERSNIPQSRTGPPGNRESMLPGPQQRVGPDMSNGVAPNGMGPGGSRLPRAAGPAPSGPPPLQQPPQPRMNGANPQVIPASRSKTPTKAERGFGPSVDTEVASSLDRDNFSPAPRDSPAELQRKDSDGIRARTPKESMDTTRSGSLTSRNASRSQMHRQQPSHDTIASIEQETPRRSLETPQHARAQSRDTDNRQVDSGLGASPAVAHVNGDVVRELDVAKSRNAWYASELALARKAGYHPATSTSPMFDERSAESFQDEDRPLLEALLKMKAEVDRVQTSIKTQGEDAAKRIAEVERQRDAAISEAIYAKTKLAAHGGGSQAGTPQPDGIRNTETPDLDRMNDISRRLAASLAAQAELTTMVEKLSHEVEAEKKAKQLADETAEAAQARVQELDSTRQKTAAECEGLRAELHEAQRVAREVSASAAEVETSSRLLAVDKEELSGKVAHFTTQTASHAAVLETLREALTASSEKSNLLERQLEEERSQSEGIRQKLSQLRAEHEARTSELETASQKLRDAEEMAEKHANEARLHQAAVLSGLGSIAAHAPANDSAANERVAILQQQVEAANAMARKNQAAADQASEKLRRAEERIAGLEAYQEQSSREGLTIRKQLQQAMRDVQASEAEKAELNQHHERLRLESNAFEVQLKTLKNLLEERGVNAVDHRRSRVLDSPNSRFGTPEMNRVRELEQQIDSMNKVHEELRASFEQREHDVSKDWEEKLQALHNDHQAAVKYLRGTEKMLAKMKQELDRYKNANTKLEEELKQATSTSRSPTKEQSAEWEAERMSLRTELSNVQETMKTNVTRLETQLATLQTDLAAARQEAEVAASKTKQAESSATQSRADLDSLRQQYTVVEERAREAENRVQIFLDQFENSVDSYRRQSQVPGGSSNGDVTRHRAHDSIASADSLYSRNDGSSTPEAPNNRPASTATRNSMALDNLASELDALRSHWETTNKAYRLSDRFDFERTPTKEQHDTNEGISQWRDSVDSEISVQEIAPKKPVPAQGSTSTAPAANGPPAGML